MVRQEGGRVLEPGVLSELTHEEGKEVTLAKPTRCVASLLISLCAQLQDLPGTLPPPTSLHSP